MQDAEIKIAIVTPVHNRKAITLQCLRSISRLEHDGFSIQVVIVDDGSTDGTGEAIKNEFPDVEIVRGDGNLWFTEGTNVAVRTALRYEPKYVLMINNDQVFDSAALKYMLQCAENYPRSIVGSLLLLWDQPHKLFQTSPIWNAWLGGWRHWYSQTVWTVPDRPWEVELIVGNCVLVPTLAINEVGLMNSKAFLNFGDAEYTPRMRRNDWRLLIEPRARVFCKPNDLISGFRNLPLRKKVREFLLSQSGPYSLRRRISLTIGSAPNWRQGLLAVIFFYLRAVFRINSEGPWGRQQLERPLKEVFKEHVVD